MNEKIKAKAQALYPPQEKASEYVAFLRGAKLADKTIVEKACEWLEDCAVVDIEEFRKAMEE